MIAIQARQQEENRQRNADVEYQRAREAAAHRLPRRALAPDVEIAVGNREHGPHPTVSSRRGVSTMMAAISASLKPRSCMSGSTFLKIWA